MCPGKQKDEDLNEDPVQEFASDENQAAEESLNGAANGLESSAPAAAETAWQREKEELSGQLQRKHDELLRKQADFDNFRRISRSEQEEAREYALFSFLEKLLPILDNLERALQSARQANVAATYVEGLEMIYKQLAHLLELEGVTVIDCAGRPFDPHYHHAVMQAAEGEGEPGTVTEELQRGYMHKKRVLRPAMVKVCRD
ncbi:MAG: nucleotide exchange factor GrpE [Bacillota bacterium]